MKPTPQDTRWQRLVESARQVPDNRDTAAPFGFATRVAALAFSKPKASLAATLDRFSWKALILSCILMTLGIASSYSTLISVNDDESTPQDPVSEIIEVSS